MPFVCQRPLPMKIPESTLEQINAQADLVAIIGRHTTLKPAGKEFKGCCPFHGEKTPSFYVNPQTNLYYCFGCGAKGNAIGFLVDYERYSFIEAVKELAQKTGIELPKEDQTNLSYQRKISPPTKTTSQPTTQTPQAQSLPTNPHHSSNQNSSNQNSPSLVPSFYQFLDGTLYGLLMAVSAFYEQELYQNLHALSYLEQRGLDRQTIAKFNLGYAPSGWQHLHKVFPHDIEGLKILGLIRTSQTGKDFDLFRERIMFAIKDKQGRIVGFAGRALDDDTTPKYLNSTDSVVFQKQHILYGYYESRQVRASDWLLVEGYLDVISLYQAGIYGAVAPMGTAVNEKQIAMLLRFNDSLTLCFDGDKAGQKAALRTLEVAMPVLNDGKTLKFLTLPNNHDPDTYVKTYGAEATRTAIAGAVSLSDYIYQVLAGQYDLNLPEQKAAAMAQLKEISAKLPKGSTFKSWLNNDIYQRLRAIGKFSQSPKPQPPTCTQISQTDELLLCLLYKPSLVINNPLETLYQDSGLVAIDQQFAQRLSPPPLPTWQTLSDRLFELYQAINIALPFLAQGDTPQAIDANAHLILSGLSNLQLQKALSKQWRDFFYSNQHHQDGRIRLLFDELLCQIVIKTLKHQQQHAQGLTLASLYKKRLLALEKWDKAVIKSAFEQS